MNYSTSWNITTCLPWGTCLTSTLWLSLKCHLISLTLVVRLFTVGTTLLRKLYHLVTLAHLHDNSWIIQWLFFNRRITSLTWWSNLKKLLCFFNLTHLLDDHSSIRRQSPDCYITKYFYIISYSAFFSSRHTSLRKLLLAYHELFPWQQQFNSKTTFQQSHHPVDIRERLRFGSYFDLFDVVWALWTLY